MYDNVKVAVGSAFGAHVARSGYPQRSSFVNSGRYADCNLVDSLLAPLTAAGLARRVNRLAFAVASGAGLRERKETLRVLYLARPLALGAGLGACSRLRACAGTDLAIFLAGYLKRYLYAFGSVVERKLQVVLEVRAFSAPGSAARRTPSPAGASAAENIAEYVAEYVAGRGYAGGYADYWLAYALTDLSKEKVILAPTGDNDRYAPYLRYVRSLNRVILLGPAILAPQSMVMIKGMAYRVIGSDPGSRIPLTLLEKIR